MRSRSIPVRLRHLVPALALGFAVGLPGAAEARGGAGGSYGGGSFRGGVFVAPRGAVGPALVRPGIAAFPSHGFQGGGFRQPSGIVVLPRRSGFPFGTIGISPLDGVAVPPFIGTTVPPFVGTTVLPFIGARVSPFFGTAALPYIGTTVPPFPAAAVPPSFNTAVRPYIGRTAALPVRSTVSAAEIWRFADGAWHLEPTVPGAQTWHRSGDGRWSSGTVGIAVD